MIVAGMTGGIGTGKSTVAAIFEEAGALIIDADKIAKKVVQQARPAWRKIVKHFGRNVLLPDGEIDRKKLADIIFSEPQQKVHLNRIVHPFVIEEIERKLKKIEKVRPESVVILDIPLLIEAGMERDLSDIIVVYIPEAIQLQRLMARDQLNETEALARIRAQMPIDEKKSRATILIDNSASPEDTRKIALKVFKELKQRSGSNTVHNPVSGR